MRRHRRTRIFALREVPHGSQVGPNGPVRYLIMSAPRLQEEEI